MYNDSNPHENIPISFNMYKPLHDTYYSIEMSTDESDQNSITRGT